MASMGTVVSMYQNLIKEWTKRPVNLDTVGNLLTSMKVIIRFKLTRAYWRPFMTALVARMRVSFSKIVKTVMYFLYVFVHFRYFAVLFCSFLKNSHPCFHAQEYSVPAPVSSFQHLSKLKFGNLLLISL